MSRVTHPSSYARLVVVAAAAALVLGGCGAQQAQKPAPSPTVALPTESVSVPAGVTLTKPGTQLAFGDVATVGFAPTAARSTALQLTVRKVFQGRISDLAAYDLDATALKARPYYVTITVKNVGDGQIGRSAIPLWALAQDNTLIGSSGFTNAFSRCPSQALPRDFAAGASTRTCLMFLMPAGGTLVGVSYRPVMDTAPIVWKGSIVKPAVHHAKKRKKKAAH
jgi:hypothetical protein